MSKMRLRNAGSCIFMVLLPACAVGPDFVPPDYKMPLQWVGLADGRPAVQPASIVKSTPITESRWWENFNDPKLTSLVQEAFQANLDLKQAVSRIRQARAAYRQAVANEFPDIIANAAYRRSGSGAAGGTFSQGTGTSTNNDLPGPSNTTVFTGGGVSNLFTAGFDSIWEIDVFGGIRRDIERANAELTSREEDRRDVLVSLAAEVALNYFALRGLQEQAAITQKNLEAQRGVAALTRERYQAGFANALDTANAEAQVATTLAALPPLQAGVSKTIYTLSILLAKEPGALEHELSLEGPKVVLPAEIPVALPSELLKRRPDIRRAEANLHAATASIGVARAELFPSFSLRALINWQGDTIGSVGKNRSWSIVPGLSYPLFDAGRIRANIDIQNELQQQSLMQYESIVLNALKEVESALVDYQREQERQKALAESVVQNQKALELSHKLYVTGAAEFLNVLTAERSLYAAEDALVQSTRTINTNLVALYKALGGGWED